MKQLFNGILIFESKTPFLESSFLIKKVYGSGLILGI